MRLGQVWVIAALIGSSLVANFAGATEPGRLTGGEKYEIPHWFKDSFLELADDAAEAAEADKHAVLFMYLDECPYCDAVLRESFVQSEYTEWLQSRFDVIDINIKGAREVAFSETVQVTEKALAELLKVRQTPAVIFLDGTNKPVLRTNGYKTSGEYRRIFEFVDSKSYLTKSLREFVAAYDDASRYALRAHPTFSGTRDLSAIKDGLVVIFEDAYCLACGLLHDTLLADPDVQSMLGKLTVVRLDAEDQSTLITPGGKVTTPSAWVEALGMTARPGFVLFGGGVERVRIEGVLRHFHFMTSLRYIAERQYREYATLREFSRAYQQGVA